MFSVAKSWDAIRPRGNQVVWSRIVWFSHNIPRHAFHLWLVMRNGFKTHDKMRQWDVGGDTNLNLLRFLQDIILYLLPMGNKMTAKSVFGKLILEASVYFIWMERNNRIFKNTRRSLEEIRDMIMVTVRLKLISFRFKNTTMFKLWLEVNVAFQPHSIVLNFPVINTNLPGFRRFLDNKLEDEERMWNLIQNGPYQRPMIPNPDNTQQKILEPLLMIGSEVTSHVRHSRLMDEFDKFAAKEGE
ncbi:homeodomain-like protein [Tanacetum coccineum]